MQSEHLEWGLEFQEWQSSQVCYLYSYAHFHMHIWVSSGLQWTFENHMVFNISHVLCTFFQGTILLENVSSGTEVARLPQTSQMPISPCLIYFCIHRLIQNRHQENV